MIQNPWLLRATAGVSIGLWIAALFSRFDVYLHGFGDGYGYFLLSLGWLGPLELSFAWYANIPLLVFLYQLVIGQPPRFRPTVITFLLAMTALVPHFEFDMDGRFHQVLLWGPAVLLWLLSFVPVLATVVAQRLLQSN